LAGMVERGERKQTADGMKREVYVRFCEALGVEFPGPTRPTLPSTASAGHGSYLGISCRQWGWRTTADLTHFGSRAEAGNS